MTASIDLLARLHEQVTIKLLERIESGEATAAEFAQAIKLLKDNGIEALATGENALSRLQDSIVGTLPFTDPNDPMIQ